MDTGKERRRASAGRILEDARKLTGLDHPGLNALARRIDTEAPLLERLRELSGVHPRDDAERGAVQERIGKDWRGFYVLGLLRRLPQAKALYNGLHLPDSLFRATMADIPLKMREYRLISGDLGLRDDQFDWLQLHMAGEIFRLGRLQFKRLWLGEDGRFGQVALPRGTPLIDVHIPGDGSLSPGAVRESYRQAAAFFQEVFRFDGQGFLCASWLLAPELHGLLPEGANIRAFSEAYHLTGPGWADGSVYHYVFLMNKPDDLQSLPEGTLLRRNLKRFLMSGGVIHGMRGFRPIE